MAQVFTYSSLILDGVGSLLAEGQHLLDAHLIRLSIFPMAEECYEPSPLHSVFA